MGNCRRVYAIRPESVATAVDDGRFMGFFFFQSNRVHVEKVGRTELNDCFISFKSISDS